MKMRFLADMQNPSRPPVEIKVSASTNHAKITKKVETSLSIGDRKKRTIFYRFLSIFGRFWDSLLSRKTQQIEKVPAKTHAKKSMKKKQDGAGHDAGVGGIQEALRILDSRALLDFSLICS